MDVVTRDISTTDFLAFLISLIVRKLFLFIVK